MTGEGARSENEERVGFEPSKLGTLEYWQDFYERELNNLRENPDDHGEVWFGTQVERRIVEHIVHHYPSDCTAVLDIGCGNGSLLKRLAAKDFRHLHGCDYAEASVDLAQLNCPSVHFFQFDIRDRQRVTNLAMEKIDLFHDKGTFDALCLTEGEFGQPETIVQAYSTLMRQVGSSGCHFVLTSCNWTRQELVELFTGDSFELIDEPAIVHPSFSFGGKSGQAVTTVIMKIK